jgi:trimeric autotransporter adhesin
MVTRISSLVAGLLFFFISGAAQPIFTITPQTQSVNADDTFSVNVVVNNFNSIVSLQYALTWNSAVIRYAGIDQINLPGLNLSNFGIPGSGTVPLSKLSLTWFQEQLTGVTLPAGTSLYRIRFVAVNGGNTTIAFSNDPPGIEILNASLQDVGLTMNNSMVTVTGTGSGGTGGGGGGSGGSGGGGGTASGFNLSIQNQSATAGVPFCTPVTASGFENILGMQFSINYNSTLLDFVSVSNFGLAGLTAASFGVPGNGTTPGNITLSWFDENLTGKSLATGSKLFDVCLTGKANGTSAVQFSNMPTSIEISDGNGQIVPFNSSAGAITITGGSSTPTFSGFGLIAGGGNVGVGSEICIPVTTQQFTGILGMQYSMNYTPAILQFKEIRNFGLPGLTQELFGIPGSGTSAGNLTMSWFDNNLAGVTLPNGTKLYDVCFTALSNGVSSFSFSSNPTFIEISNSAGAVVPFNSLPATVVVGTDSGGGGGGGVTSCDTSFIDDTIGSGFGLLVGNKVSLVGESFCLPVTTQNFTNILGMQFSMNYNASQLRLDNVSGFNLAGLNETLFGTPTGGGSPGNITLSWFDNNLTGITIPNGTKIYDVCFTSIAPGNSTVTFSSNPTFIEISNSAGGIVPFDSKFGRVIVCSEFGGSAVQPLQVNFNNVSSFVDSSVCVDVRVRNFNAIKNLQLAIRLDTSLLQFVSGNGSVLPGLTTMMRNDSLILSWSGTATNLGLDTTLIRLCFRGKREGTATLRADTATGKFVVINQGDQNPGLTSQSGTVTISPNVETTDFLLDITDAMVNPGTAFCLPIRVFNFNSILGLQFSMRFDTTIVRLDSFSNFGLPGLTPAVFGTPSLGVITLAWVDDALQGRSLPNGSVLFSPCFTAVGQVGDFTAIDFSNTPTAIEVTNFDGDNVVFTGSSGVVSIVGFGPLAITDSTVMRPCASSNDGRISIVVSGGMAPYSYSWSNGGNAASIMNLAPGTYTVTVTDATAASITRSFVLGANPAISITANVTNVTGIMANANGSIRLSVSGGNAPYRYFWSNGRTDSLITGLASGQYTVVVTDQNGCSKDSSFTVGFTSLALTADVSGISVACTGESNGVINILIQGGALPYSVSFGDGPQFSSNDGLIIRSGLPSGFYTYVISDAQDSIIMGSVEIMNPDSLRVTGVSLVSNSNRDNCNGSITLAVSGGTMPYTMNWSNASTGLMINRLCDDQYTGILTDANGCRLDIGPLVVPFFGGSGVVKNVVCASDSDGSIDLTLEGGTAPFTYIWRNASGATIGNIQDVTGLRPGMYSVDVVDAGGARLVLNFVVEFESNLGLDIAINSNFNGFDVRCEDSSDGLITATGRDGAGGYTYNWVLQGNSVGTGPVFDQARAGIYVVEVRDAMGCIVSDQIELRSPMPIVINAEIRNANCFDQPSGEIFADARGGVPAFRYRWSNSSVGARLENVRAGIYRVTATDGNECQGSMEFEIEEPDPIEVEVESTPATVGCNGIVEAIVMGGTAPYNYIWTGIFGQTSSIVTDLCPGSYEVFVTDALGCVGRLGEFIGRVADRRFPCNESSAVLTPNGDGFNEVFFINCVEEIPDNTLEVYNRWGQLVFRTLNYDNSWRGTNVRGEILPEGAYYYVLQYVDMDLNRQQITGSFALVRD